MRPYHSHSGRRFHLLFALPLEGHFSRISPVFLGNSGRRASPSHSIPTTIPTTAGVTRSVNYLASSIFFYPMKTKPAALPESPMPSSHRSFVDC